MALVAVVIVGVFGDVAGGVVVVGDSDSRLPEGSLRGAPLVVVVVVNVVFGVAVRVDVLSLWEESNVDEFLIKLGSCRWLQVVLIQNAFPI